MSEMEKRSRRDESTSTDEESLNFHPTTSSTVIRGGRDETIEEEESNISVTKSRGCQTTSFTECGTQTSPLTQPGDDEDRSALFISMSTLANRLLHASYWFLATSSLASEMGFERLKRTIELRFTTASLSAARLFENLISHDTLLMADVAKPKFNFQACPTAHIAKLVHDLDKWLVSSTQAVLLASLDVGTSDQVNILQTVLAEQTRFAEESKSMNSETFLIME